MSTQTEAVEITEAVRKLDTKIALASEVLKALKKSREEAIVQLLDLFVERPLLDEMENDE